MCWSLPSGSDVIEKSLEFIRVNSGIDESDGRFPSSKSSVIDQGEDGSHHRSGGRSSEDEPEFAIDGDDIVCTIGTQILIMIRVTSDD